MDLAGHGRDNELPFQTRRGFQVIVVRDKERGALVLATHCLQNVCRWQADGRIQASLELANILKIQRPSTSTV